MEKKKPLGIINQEEVTNLAAITRNFGEKLSCHIHMTILFEDSSISTISSIPKKNRVDFLEHIINVEKGNANTIMKNDEIPACN